MSPLEPATAAPKPPKEPELDQLEDALYELVAGGLPANANAAPVGAIQQFLHEHARAAKSKQDFLAFFGEHDLKIPDAPGWGGSHRFDLPVPPLMPVQIDPDPRTLALDIGPVGEDDTRPVVLEGIGAAHTARRGAGIALWLVLGAVTAAFALAAWWGYGTITALQGQLQAAEEHGAHSREVIDHLRERTADIESSVAATGQVVQQVDAKSDLLLESVTALQKPQPRWQRRTSGH